MLVHTHPAAPAYTRRALLATLRFAWLFATTAISLTARVLGGVLKFIGISLLFMTEMW